MKLQHHLGGLENLGPIPHQETRVFVEPWERTIFGIHVAMMGLSNHLDIRNVPTSFKNEWTWADLRTGAEGMNPLDYFRLRYYEKWLGGITGFFIENGYVTEAEIDAKTQQFLAEPDVRKPDGGSPEIDEQIVHYLETGDSPLTDTHKPPIFQEGQQVRVRDVPPTDHTRLPGHLRGRIGIVETVYDGTYQYFHSTGPDGIGPPMPIYSVRFDPADLWNEMREPGNAAFYADLFEVYLEPADN